MIERVHVDPLEKVINTVEDDEAARRETRQDTAAGCRHAPRPADLLRDSALLATEILAQWYGREITVEIMDRAVRLIQEDSSYPVRALGREHHSPGLAVLLRCVDNATVQHRNIRIHVEGESVGFAFSTVLLDRVTARERATLTATDVSLGRALQAEGIQRRMLAMTISDDGGYGHTSDGHAIATQALLCRNDTPVAYVQEKFFFGSLPPDGARRAQNTDL